MVAHRGSRRETATPSREHSRIVRNGGGDHAHGSDLVARRAGARRGSTQAALPARTVGGVRRAVVLDRVRRRGALRGRLADRTGPRRSAPLPDHGMVVGPADEGARADDGDRPRVEGLELLAGGNAVVLARHASLADSLLSGWVFSNVAALRPRYVLKRELLFDPCLDIVGLRVPNHFLDRQAADSTVELDALRELGGHVGAGSVGVIFAEGTRSNDVKRARALEKIGEGDPERAARLAGLAPAPASTGRIGCVVGGGSGRRRGAGVAHRLRWARHVLGDDRPTLQAVATGPVRDQADRPIGRSRWRGVRRWIDDRWLEMDAEVDRALSSA